MEINRFVFEGIGEEVIKVRAGRATGYITASIPPEVLQIWHRRFGRLLKRTTRFRFRVRSGRRPRSKPQRLRKRWRRPKKHYRGRVRYWADAPRR